jgi:hypothetical protein
VKDFIAILDGHAGSEVAQIVAEQLPLILQRHMKKNRDIFQCLKQVCTTHITHTHTHTHTHTSHITHTKHTPQIIHHKMKNILNNFEEERGNQQSVE